MILRLAFLVFCLSTGWTVGEAAAQNIVTLCQSDTQQGNGRNLQQALRIGGNITFACPSRQASIRMTVSHTVPANVSIDGGDRVTLDANGVRVTLFWAPSGNFTLRNLTIQNAERQRLALHGVLGSILTASRDVTLEGVTIQGSSSPIVISGSGRIVRSRFLGNRGTALDIDGDAHVDSSSFIGNDLGLSMSDGIVKRSVFNENSRGAIRIAYPKGETRIVDSSFNRNHGRGALLLSQRASLNTEGGVIVRRSSFIGNSNQTGGGAITIYDSVADAPASVRDLLRLRPPASFIFAYNHFSENAGASGGAISADLANTAGLVITGGVFTGNIATQSGGAIQVSGRSLDVRHSLFRGNRSGGPGGALFGHSREPSSTWRLTNSLVVENEAPVPGGIIEAESLEVTNVTVANNRGIGILGGGAPPTISNAILSDNSEGNCRGVAASLFRGGNLQHGQADCPGVQEGDPFLDEMYVPAYGSPALSLGNLSVCTSPAVGRKDIAFQGRGYDGRCSLGAFEHPPVRRLGPGEAR